MEIAFDTQELRKLCEGHKDALSLYGSEIASKLQRRLADLDAATNAREVFTGNPSFGAVLTLGLNENARMIFNPNHVKCPMLENGDIDWQKVSRIKLMGIEVEK